MKYRLDTSLYFLLIFTLLLSVPTMAQNTEKPSMVFLGASNTNTEEWVNGSYVTKMPDRGSPWTDINITNSGVDSTGLYTYYQDPDLLSSRLIEYSTDVIFVMLGGNDIIPQFGQPFPTLELLETRFNWLLGEINNNTNNQLVIISNIIWSPLEGIWNVFLPDLVEVYYEFQEFIENQTRAFGFQFVDVFNATKGNGNYYQGDSIHLNEAGHRSVSIAVHQQLAETVEDFLFFELNRGIIGLIIGLVAVILLVVVVYYTKYRKDLTQ